jgi:hypothetical protein
MAKKSGAGQPGTERVFTIELDSGSDLRKVSVPNGVRHVLLEGTIGILKRTGFVEDGVLEVAGTSGVLRVDLASGDLATLEARGGETN